MAETFQLHVHSLKHAGDFLRKVQRSVVLCITGSGIQPGNAFPQLFYFFITHTGWKSFMATVTLSHLTQKVLVLYNTKSFLIYVGLDDETCAGIHTIIKRLTDMMVLIVQERTWTQYEGYSVKGVLGTSYWEELLGQAGKITSLG